jgi:predicted transcriptional regulator
MSGADDARDAHGTRGESGRVRGPEYARRVNAAAELLAAGTSVAEAARVLAQRYGCSARQARRYAEHAAAGRVVVPEETTVFTVKLPSTLVARVRARARESGTTISAMVAQALTEYLAGGKRKRRRA